MNEYYKDKQKENTEMMAYFLWLVKWFVIASILLLAAKGAMAADLQKEIPSIRKAAERNGIKFGSDDWFLLLAIRLSENGKAGKEFGILSVKANSLDAQAANAAVTVVNQHRRSGIKEVNGRYIESLAKRYCPVGAANDPQGLNKNWIKNVTFYFNKLKKGKN